MPHFPDYKSQCCISHTFFLASTAKHIETQMSGAMATSKTRFRQILGPSERQSQSMKTTWRLRDTVWCVRVRTGQRHGVDSWMCTQSEKQVHALHERLTSVANGCYSDAESAHIHWDYLQFGLGLVNWLSKSCSDQAYSCSLDALSACINFSKADVHISYILLCNTLF